ncbi:hypothetical protein WJX79_009529 [Trebouxia sp. C0005]
MDVFCCSGKRGWEAVHSLATTRSKVGQTVLIMSVHAKELKCLNDFLADDQIAGITMVADESDNLWRSRVRSFVQVRARNGYPNVWAVVLADDDNTIQTLYKFIQEALKLAGTGKILKRTRHDSYCGAMTEFKDR